MLFCMFFLLQKENPPEIHPVDSHTHATINHRQPKIPADYGNLLKGQIIVLFIVIQYLKFIWYFQWYIT